MQAEFWNERFGRTEFVYGKAANAFLHQVLPTIKGKTLLLPGEGEGRNAVWAVTQQWQVTAFDQSTAGRAKCQQLADEFNVSVDYIISSAEDFKSEIKYDVVGLFYLHLPSNLRRTFHNTIWENLVSGGHLILEGFNPNQLNYTSGGPKDATMLFDLETLKHDFPLAVFSIAEQIETILDEGPFHQGKAAVTRILAIKP